MGMNNRKYRIHNGQIRNKFTDTYIPEDEPTFVLRASDSTAIKTLLAYADAQDPKIADDLHQGAIKDFQDFAEANPDKMRTQTPARPVQVTETDETEVAHLADTPADTGEEHEQSQDSDSNES